MMAKEYLNACLGQVGALVDFERGCGHCFVFGFQMAARTLAQIRPNITMK